MTGSPKSLTLLPNHVSDTRRQSETPWRDQQLLKDMEFRHGGEAVLPQQSLLATSNATTTISETMCPSPCNRTGTTPTYERPRAMCGRPRRDCKSKYLAESRGARTVHHPRILPMAILSHPCLDLLSRLDCRNKPRARSGWQLPHRISRGVQVFFLQLITQDLPREHGGYNR